MHYWADFIDKFKDVFFENLVYFCELSDITKSKNSAFLFALKHRIHIPFLDNIFTNDFGPCTSEYNAE